MKTTERRRRRHEQMKLMSVEERREKAAEILTVGVLRLLAKDGKLREVEPGSDEYEQDVAGADPRVLS
jgi:hypothetical protein